MISNIFPHVDPTLVMWFNKTSCVCEVHHIRWGKHTLISGWVEPPSFPHVRVYMVYDVLYLFGSTCGSFDPSQLTHCCHLSNSRKIYFNHCDLCIFWFGSNTAFWVNTHFCCESSAVKLVLFLGTLWDGLMDWIGIKWRKCENHKHLPVATWGFILIWYSNCRVLPAFQWAKHMGPTSTRRKQTNVGYRYETEGAFDKPRHCIDIGANYNRM